jgi:multiple inositol-polyphosphate phosphatase/2,3-bisphosphoglycerate 3-phosphatase
MLDMLEYREDLKYYWKDGYGYKINTEQACVLVKDAMDNFRNITMGGITGKEEQNGIFYFTHSGTILKLLSYLGLYKEEINEQTGHRLELRHDNYNKMKDSRNWRTSFIDPFASNVGLVLKKCYGILRDSKVTLMHLQSTVFSHDILIDIGFVLNFCNKILKNSKNTSDKRLINF